MDIWLLNLLQNLSRNVAGWWQKRREQEQHIFMRGAIGQGYCLVDPDAPIGEVSLDTVDVCVRNAQREQPRVAKKCGIPEENDPKRPQKLERILHQMEDKGKIEYRPPRWKVKSEAR